jgi:hypothetical protein
MKIKTIKPNKLEKMCEIIKKIMKLNTLERNQLKVYKMKQCLCKIPVEKIGQKTFSFFYLVCEAIGTAATPGL